MIDKISKRLLELEFKSNHSIITKGLKRIVKKVLPSLKNMFQNVEKAWLIVLVVMILHTILKKTKNNEKQNNKKKYWGVLMAITRNQPF